MAVAVLGGRCGGRGGGSAAGGSPTHLPMGVVVGVSVVTLACGQAPRTEITKWQDGKQAAVSITYDDSSINQFRIALPLMNDRGLPGTFFVITGEIPGSRYHPTFVGRPIMEILHESATVPTNKDNVFERASMLRYLREVQRIEVVLKNFRADGRGAGDQIAKGDFAQIESALAALRQTGATYALGAKPYVPVRGQESGRPPAEEPGGLTWDEFRRYAAQGHEFANHLVSHAFTPRLDEANILYEAEKARDDLREQLGEEHTFSIEAAYGVHDERVGRILLPRFPVTRNWVPGEFMDFILRDDFMDAAMKADLQAQDPAQSKKPYVQWQRGLYTKTPLDVATGWVDTSLDHGVWLVLVIHGVEGIGWQPVPTDTLRAYFDYMKAREDRLWVATFRDATKYARERMNSAVTTEQAGEAIEVDVTHSLDPKLYDLPLSARTTVPSQWTAVEFRQGNQTRTVPVQRDGAESYVTYRIAPNGGVARLVRAE